MYKIMLLRERADVNRVYDETSMRKRNSKVKLCPVQLLQKSWSIKRALLLLIFRLLLTSITFLFRLRENDAVMPHHEAERRICAFVFMAT